MALLSEIIEYCNDRTHLTTTPDFPGANNGLQVQNNGDINHIGAAVDAGMTPFQMAAERGIDFIIVHHGLFWDSPTSMTGLRYKKFKYLFEHNIAVYSCHLPLDGHREIGNNAIIAKKLDLPVTDWIMPLDEFAPVALCEGSWSRDQLSQSLKELFPHSYTPIETGPDAIQRIAICSGSGASVVDNLKDYGIDTLITGELRQKHYNQAQEEQLNLYCCGHYATEVFGVHALAEEVAQKFNLPHSFLTTDCPL